MKIATRLLARLSVPVFMVLFAVAAGNAQTTGGASREWKPSGEISGLVGGSALLSSGGGAAADGMWGVRAGGFPRRRFGVEGTFEQSMREPDLRYLGGEFVIQFPKQDWKKAIPFVHAGAGSFLYEGRVEGALSFGAGLKQYINERFGVRVGVQDRMLFRLGNFHRLDLYAGIVFRF